MSKERLIFKDIKNPDAIMMTILEFEDIYTGKLKNIKMSDLIKSYNIILEKNMKQEINKNQSDRLSLSEIYYMSYEDLSLEYSVPNIRQVLTDSKCIYYFAKIHINLFAIVKDIIRDNSSLFNDKEIETVFNILLNKYSKEEFKYNKNIQSVMSKMESIGIQSRAFTLKNLDLNDINFKSLTDEQLDKGYLEIEKITYDSNTSQYPNTLCRFPLKKNNKKNTL